MDRLYYTTVTIPAGTTITSPYSVVWPLEDNELVYVDINVPPGPSGLMGFRILWAQQQVIPWGNDSWLVTDNEKIHVDCDFAMTITGLVIEGYNTDIFAHTIYIRGLIRTETYQQQLAAEQATGALALPAGVSQIETGVAETTLPPGIGETTQPSLPEVTTPSIGEVTPVSSPSSPASVPVVPPITPSTPAPAKVEIPNVYGEKAADATKKLKADGFRVHQVPPTTPKGDTATVTDTVPARGVKAIKGSTVTIHIKAEKPKPVAKKKAPVKSDHALVKAS